jgi:hypothetical protein
VGCFIAMTDAFSCTGRQANSLATLTKEFAPSADNEPVGKNIEGAFLSMKIEIMIAN